MNKSFAIFSVVVLLLTSMAIIDYKLTGQVIAQVGVTVQCLVAISLPVDAANFGTLSQGASDSTTDGSPPPLVIQNDGGTLVDVTIARENGSTPLFSGTGGGDNSNSFRFKTRDPNATSFNASASVVTFTPVPGTTPLAFVGQLRYASGHNRALVDLLVAVPSDEPSGAKSEYLELIASQSGTDCGINPYGDAECIVIDLSSARIDDGDKRVTDVKVKNTCKRTVNIFGAKLDWTASAALDYFRIDGDKWKYDCDWAARRPACNRRAQSSVSVRKTRRFRPERLRPCRLISTHR